ncbi:MAG: hypothetical protein PHH49_02260 [Candidatus Omnitrophica bacterium]|nr:hypothetical protein [Candidatus Omnitrophota bacterium]
MPHGRTKKILITTMVLVIAASALYWRKDALVLSVFEGLCSRALNVEVHAGAAELSLTKLSLGIKDIVFYQPLGFGHDVLARVPEVYVDMGGLPISDGRMRFDEIFLYIAEFDIVRGRDGKLNLSALPRVVGDGNKNDRVGKPQGKDRGIIIKKFRVKADTLRYIDLSGANAPSIKKYELNIDQIFYNVDDPGDAFGKLANRAFHRAGMAGMLNLPAEGVKSVVRVGKHALASPVSMAEDTAKSVGKNAQDFISTAGGLLSGVAETLGKAKSIVVPAGDGDR